MLSHCLLETFDNLFTPSSCFGLLLIHHRIDERRAFRIQHIANQSKTLLIVELHSPHSFPHIPQTSSSTLNASTTIIIIFKTTSNSRLSYSRHDYSTLFLSSPITAASTTAARARLCPPTATSPFRVSGARGFPCLTVPTAASSAPNSSPPIFAARRRHFCV